MDHEAKYDFAFLFPYRALLKGLILKNSVFLWNNIHYAHIPLLSFPLC